MTRATFMRFLLAVGLFCLRPAFAGNFPLVITTEPEDPPFSMIRMEVLVGTATDIVKAALEQTGTPYRLTPYPWLRAVDIAKTQENACVYATTPTPERKPLFKWVGPIVRESWVLYARPDSDIKLSSLAEAASFRIGGSDGAAQTAYLESQGLKVETINSVGNMVANLKKLMKGHIDLWATGLKRGSYVARAQRVAGLKVVLKFHDADLYLACNPAVPDKLIDSLNLAVHRLIRQPAS